MHELLFTAVFEPEQCSTAMRPIGALAVPVSGSSSTKRKDLSADVPSSPKRRRMSPPSTSSSSQSTYSIIVLFRLCAQEHSLGKVTCSTKIRKEDEKDDVIEISDSD